MNIMLVPLKFTALDEFPVPVTVIVLEPRFKVRAQLLEQSILAQVTLKLLVKKVEKLIVKLLVRTSASARDTVPPTP